MSFEAILICTFIFFFTSGHVLVVAPVTTAHVSSLGLAPSSVFPVLQGMFEPPLHGLEQQGTISSDPYLGDSEISSLPLPPGFPEFRFPLGLTGSPLHGLQPQSAIPGHLHLGGSVASSATHPSEIPEFLSPYTTGDTHLSGSGIITVAPPPGISGLQPQSTISGDQYLSVPGLLTDTTQPLGVLGCLPPHELPIPLQYGLQPQSAIPGHLHLLGGSVTSSVTHPPEIPSFPSSYLMRSLPPSDMENRSPFFSEHVQNPSNESGKSQ